MAISFEKSLKTVEVFVKYQFEEFKYFSYMIYAFQPWSLNVWQ